MIPYAISWLIFGVTSAYMAKTRGKNPYLWFFLGMFLGVFGILFLFFGPKTKKNQGPTTIDITPQFDPSHREKLWYYLAGDNQQHGPMSFDALLRALRDGKVSKNSFVWNETLENWQPFSDFFSEN